MKHQLHQLNQLLTEQPNDDDTDDVASDDDDDNDTDTVDIVDELLDQINTNIFRTGQNVDIFEKVFKKCYRNLQNRDDKIDYLNTILFYFDLLKFQEIDNI